MKIKVNSKLIAALKKRMAVPRPGGRPGVAVPFINRTPTPKQREAMRQRVAQLFAQRAARPAPASRTAASRPTMRPMPLQRDPARPPRPARLIPAAQQIIEAQPVNTGPALEVGGNNFGPSVAADDFDGLSAADAAFHGRDGFNEFGDIESDLGLVD